jgi:virginiamycin A acetyltransferase
MIARISVPVYTVKEDVYTFVTLDDGTHYPVAAVGKNSYIVDIDCSAEGNFNLQIGRSCSVSRNVVVLINQNHDYTKISTGELSWNSGTGVPKKLSLTLQNDVWVGFGATLMGGITVRNGAVIAANAHVVKDVPPYAIVGGNPAKIIKYRFSDEQIADLLNISWWDWDDTKIAACKEDFGLSIEAFIEKHRVVPPLVSRTKPINSENPRLLFFPDFDEPFPFWKNVIAQYCQDPVGQLYIILPNNEKTEIYNKMLGETISAFAQGKGDIVGQVGGAETEEQLFTEADCYITSRAPETVRRTCLADKYGVKIISCADIPMLWSLNK